jgi:cell division protein FtsA
MAEQILELPVRRGIPSGISGLVDVVNSPIYATGVGLVLYGSKNCDMNRFRIRDNNIFSRVKARMQEWFKEFL